MICQVWVGERQCGQPAAYKTKKTKTKVCAGHAAHWGMLELRVDVGALREPV